MSRLWMASLGGEVLYLEDLPTCCRRDSHGVSGTSGVSVEEVAGFECSVCGAAWESVAPANPEVCAFGYTGEEERRGAA